MSEDYKKSCLLLYNFSLFKKKNLPLSFHVIFSLFLGTIVNEKHKLFYSKSFRLHCTMHSKHCLYARREKNPYSYRGGANSHHYFDISSSWVWFFSLFFIRKFHIELCHSRPTTYFAAPKKNCHFHLWYTYFQIKHWNMLYNVHTCIAIFFHIKL